MYLRVIKWEEPLDKEQERVMLNNLLVRYAQRITCEDFIAKTIEPHPRGGHSIFVHVDKDNAQDFVEYLYANDFRAVF